MIALGCGCIVVGASGTQYGSAQRGANGIIGLGRKFRIMDDDGSKSLDKAEYTKAINECALGLGAAALAQLFAFFDKNGGRSIDYEEFIGHLFAYDDDDDGGGDDDEDEDKDDDGSGDDDKGFSALCTLSPSSAPSPPPVVVCLRQ